MYSFRRPGTGTGGSPFGPMVVEAVWQKGVVVPGFNPALRRKDACGAWIDRANYGQTVQDGTGWEIDHMIPVAHGGSDDLRNLQPLQWQNNRGKSDSPPGGWSCATVAKL